MRSPCLNEKQRALGASSRTSVMLSERYVVLPHLCSLSCKRVVSADNYPPQDQQPNTRTSPPRQSREQTLESNSRMQKNRPLYLVPHAGAGPDLSLSQRRHFTLVFGELEETGIPVVPNNSTYLWSRCGCSSNTSCPKGKEQQPHASRDMTEDFLNDRRSFLILAFRFGI